MFREITFNMTKGRLHKVRFSWSFRGIATTKEKIALVKRDINNKGK